MQITSSGKWKFFIEKKNKEQIFLRFLRLGFTKQLGFTKHTLSHLLKQIPDAINVCP